MVRSTFFVAAAEYLRVVNGTVSVGLADSGTKPRKERHVATETTLGVTVVVVKLIIRIGFGFYPTVWYTGIAGVGRV